ncbi:MAG: serine/threonine-protein kinase [Bryobacteraceae bacterium]
MPFSAGTKLGPYELLGPIGAGGMGEVWKARDTRLDRTVAIKRLKGRHTTRFEQEARAIAALNHPNICTVHDVGPDYLVMEYVEGKPLRGPLRVEEAVKLALQIAGALEEAHGRGILHRDLKPGNILVTGKGVAKLLDFGLAKLMTDDPETDVTRTIEGTVLGTPAYMSPEQARGEPVDKRADIWAFGVVFYELLTGKMLFGDSKNVSDVIAAVLTREPDFNALPKGTPARVRRLLELCLRKDPKQRFRDIGDARLMLDEPEPETPAAPAKRRRWLWAAGFATLAALAAFAWYRWPAERPAGPFRHIQITRLTDSGKAAAAAISPDGKYVVHSVTDEGKRLPNPRMLFLEDRRLSCGPMCWVSASGSWRMKKMPLYSTSREEPFTRRLKCGGWFESKIPSSCLRFTNGSERSTGACGNSKARNVRGFRLRCR